MDANDTVAIPPFPPRIGRYQITAELGRGAMGVVYKGYDPNIGRTVAIKTVHLGVNAASNSLAARFRREAQAAGMLSHPHIVTIYDAGEDSGVFYIAMEYVEGDTLEKVIAREGALPIELVTVIMEDVGSALDHAHTRDIVHRDVKPANIMIANGRAKVMDFGVAKVASSTATATGTVIGTPSYMSPEAVKGLSVDGRADIFSLGVVLYELLTGKRPFIGENIPSVIYKIIGEQPDPPTVANPHLHSGLNVVLLHALSKDPSTRYQSCAAMIADLKNYRLLKAPEADTTLTSIAAPKTPTVNRTLAPPMVSGTVALEHETLMASGEAFPKPQAPAAPPPLFASSIGIDKGPPSKTPKILAAVLLIAALASAGVLWQHRQGKLARAAEARRKQDAAADANSLAQQQGKPSPSARTATPVPPAAPGIPTAGAPGASGDPGSENDREIFVKSNVDGATIKVDGKTKPDWTTPKKIRVPDGAHRIEVVKDGYKSVAQNPTVNEQGPKELAFSLAQAQREVEIVTTPPGAQVNVDGSDEGALTPGKYSMTYGAHSVQVRKAGYRPEVKTVTVDANTEGVTVTLQREAPGAGAGAGFGKMDPGAIAAAIADAKERVMRHVPNGAKGDGRLRVRTIPMGADIAIDGKDTTFKSPVNFPLPPGPHKVTVSHRGFEPVTRDVEILPGGEMVDVEIDLTGGLLKRRREP